MKITIARGATVNLGNYESARVDFTVEVEGDTKSFNETDKYVVEQLNKAVARIQEGAGLPPLPVSRFTGSK